MRRSRWQPLPKSTEGTGFGSKVYTVLFRPPEGQLPMAPIVLPPPSSSLHSPQALAFPGAVFERAEASMRVPLSDGIVKPPSAAAPGGSEVGCVLSHIEMVPAM